MYNADGGERLDARGIRVWGALDARGIRVWGAWSPPLGVHIPDLPIYDAGPELVSRQAIISMVIGSQHDDMGIPVPDEFMDVIDLHYWFEGGTVVYDMVGLRRPVTRCGGRT